MAAAADDESFLPPPPPPPPAPRDAFVDVTETLLLSGGVDGVPEPKRDRFPAEWRGVMDAALDLELEADAAVAAAVALLRLCARSIVTDGVDEEALPRWCDG
jgi:hypothetical protein